MRANFLFAGVFLGAIFLAVAARAQDAPRSPLTFSTGLDFSRGNYGGVHDTDIVYVPNRMIYETRPWTFGITVPYILITGSRSVTASGGEPVTFGADSGVVDTESGMGDIILSATYNQSRIDGGSVVEYTGKLKLPTADDTAGLGTGAFDFSGQIDASVPVGAFKPFVTLGYQVLGDPEGAKLNDGFFFTIGAELAASREYDFGLAFDYREAAVDRLDDAMEMVPYLGWNATERLKANFYLVVGLTNGSTEYGGGFQVTVR